VNWKTTLSSVSAAISTVVTILAALPYQLGSLGEVIPPDWKPFVVKAGLVAIVISKVWNGVVAADANPTPSPVAPSKFVGLLVAALFLGGGLFILTGCEACKPIARADATGYEVGIQGTWEAVGDSALALLNPAPASGRNGSFDGKSIVQ
jgi:hypothetical protein